MDSIRLHVLNALINIGAIVEEIDMIDKEDVNLQDYILDSIQFITFIIALEDELHVEIPDELLSYDKFLSLNGFCNELFHLING